MVRVHSGAWSDCREAPRTQPQHALVCWMSVLTFNVVFEDAGDGWVYAHVPELPEIHTQGEGLDEARQMVRDAISMVLDERRERGEALICL